MKNLLTIGGALLALAAFASTADARMGGGMGMSSSMSHGGGHGSMSSSMGSSRGSNVDMRSSNGGGRSFGTDSLRTRVKGSNWKHPIDSDNGGPGDPPTKPPKGSTQTGGGSPPQGGSWPHHHPNSGDGHGGWYDQYGHHHHPSWPSGNGTASNGDPAPASRQPR
jgi:hypothetical protein